MKIASWTHWIQWRLRKLCLWISPRFLHCVLRFYRVDWKVRSAALLVWVSVSLVGSAALLYREHVILERQFYQRSHDFQQKIENNLLKNEVVLSHLAVLFQSIHPLNIEQLRAYARRILHKHSQIRGVEYYRPDDMTTAAEPVRGIPLALKESVGSHALYTGKQTVLPPQVSSAVLQALTANHPISSLFFPNARQHSMYVLLQSVSTDGLTPRPTYPLGVIGLIIDVESLMSGDWGDSHHFDVALYRAHHRVPRNFQYEERQKLLWWQEAFHVLLGGYFFHERLHSTLPSQPFVIDVVWQPLVSVRTVVGLVVLWGGLGALSVLVLYGMARQREAVFLRQRYDVRRANERELARITLQSIQDGVLIFNHTRRIQYFNPAAVRLLNETEASLSGQLLDSCLTFMQMPNTKAATIDLQGAADFVSFSLENEWPLAFGEAVFLVSRHGVPLQLEGMLSPVYDSQGRVQGGVLTFRSMSPLRRRARAALAESVRRLREHEHQLAHAGRLHVMGEMASGIVHELNQPLSAIVTYGQAALRILEDQNETLDRSILRHALQSSVTQAERAGTIIRRLRSFLSKRELKYEIIDLNTILESTLLLAEHDIHEREVVVDVQFTRPLARVRADVIQLEQIVLNLLRNALDAVQGQYPWGRIRLSTHQHEQEVSVRLSDNGSGIDTALMEEIFTPFFTTKNANGMGLGLTISQSLAESMGGRVEACNLANGGACFTVFLPIYFPVE